MHRTLLLVPVLAGAVLLAGCQTPPAEDLAFAGGTVDPAPVKETYRLNSGEQADLVIYFPSWEYIGILKPLVADGPFLRYMNREQTEEKLGKLSNRKNVAAVICDLSIPGKDRELDMENWVRILTREGYKKIYFIRKEPTETLSEGDVLAEHPPRAPKS